MTHPAVSTERIFGQAERRGVPPLLLIVGAIAVLAAVIILALIMGRSRPGRLVFDILVTPGKEAQIYAINGDGSDLCQLTHEKSYNIMPIWSPDGQRIAFLSSPRTGQTFQLYVMDADGSNVKSLTQGSSDIGYPSWSPDGQHIAFNIYRDKSWYVCVIEANGAVVFCASVSNFALSGVVWSPDGTQLAFSPIQADTKKSQIHIINADGSGRRQLKGDDNALHTWLPDNHIVYRDSESRLCLIAADGSNDHCWPGDHRRTTYETLSPDGTSIAFESIQSGHYEIYVMNPDGSNIRNLTDGTGGLSPVWSPDSQHIVFTSMRRNPLGELFIMDRDGANIHSLLENKATSENASWVP